MKTKIFRVLGLAAIVLLSNLPKAKASEGECHIDCCDGRSYVIQTASGSVCCDFFGYYCGYYGGAYREDPGGLDSYCLSISCES